VELLDRNCPICGPAGTGRVAFPAKVDPGKMGAYAFASRKMPEYMHFRLLQCGTCDVLYASPAPSAGTLAKEYERAAYDSGVEASFAAETYAHYLDSHVLPALRQKSGALDIGTGNGTFLKHLLDRGFTDVRGVEPSSAPIAVAAPEIRPLIRHDVFRVADYARASLDLVSCFMTIEHVADPLRLAKDAFDILRPGGALYLVSHSHRSLQAKVLGDHSPIFDIEHLQLFSPQSLRAMMKEAGFTNVVVVPIANRYPLSYWLRLFPLPTPLKKTFDRALSELHVAQLAVPMRVGNLATIGIKA
jgi:SAM-dependent methyltransferase